MVCEDVRQGNFLAYYYPCRNFLLFYYLCLYFGSIPFRRLKTNERLIQPLFFCSFIALFFQIFSAVELAMDITKPFIGDMGIDLGSNYIFVT